MADHAEEEELFKRIRMEDLRKESLEKAERDRRGRMIAARREGYAIGYAKGFATGLRKAKLMLRIGDLRNLLGLPELSPGELAGASEDELSRTVEDLDQQFRESGL